jgi:hypothetical protein
MAERRLSLGLRKYLSHLDALQMRNVQLTLVCVFSAVIIGLLAFGMIRMAVSLRDRPVVAVPGLKEITVLKPGVYEEEMVYAFAEHVMTHLTNYNPETVVANFAYAQRFFDPQFRSVFLSRMPDPGRLAADEVASGFYPQPFQTAQDTGSSPVSLKDRSYAVTLKGQRVNYIGREIVEDYQTRYLVHIVRVPPTKANQFGLVVTGIQQIKENSP